MKGEPPRGYRGHQHSAHSGIPAGRSLSSPTLWGSLCPEPSRHSIDICWMSSVDDQQTALMYSRNHMIPRERKYSMSQIRLVGESVFMTPGLRAKYDPKANLLWLIDQWIFPHHFSHGHLETLSAIRCQLLPETGFQVIPIQCAVFAQKSGGRKGLSTLAVPTLPTHSRQVQPCFHCVQSQGWECLLWNEWGFYRQTEFIPNALLSPPQPERAWASPSTTLRLRLLSCKVAIMLYSLLCH